MIPPSRQQVLAALLAGLLLLAGIGAVMKNRGDVSAFDSLDGIGLVTAQKIEADRQANGPFASIDELDRVPGIGPTTVEALRSSVTL